MFGLSALFQSAFIAVVCLTLRAGSYVHGAWVSIRFHRGGLSHCCLRSSLELPVLVSIRFHRGGLSHRARLNSLLDRRVSIRFHRGGLSHGVNDHGIHSLVLFQSAFIAVVCLTFGVKTLAYGV